MSGSWTDDVQAFHLAGSVPIGSEPSWLPPERQKLRRKLIEEEVKETFDAIEARDMAEVADGIADSIYVLIGMALEMGIPLDRVWDEVQRANMAKFAPCVSPLCVGGVDYGHSRRCRVCSGTGLVAIRREDGKILKPDGWTPPDIAGVLGLES